jgi:hypothetical protein
MLGGVLPRGDLDPSMSVQIVTLVPLAALGVADRVALGFGTLTFAAHAAAGWSPLGEQAPAIVPGRGKTQVIQSSQVFPIDLGASVALETAAAVLPYATLGLAAEVTETTMRAFSTPSETTRDVAFGGTLSLGALLPLGSGHLIGELRYREVHVDIGAPRHVGERTLSAATLQLGYLLAL